MRGRNGWVAAIGLATLMLGGCADSPGRWSDMIPHWPPEELSEPPQVPPPDNNGSYEDFLVELGKFESAGADEVEYGHPGNRYGYIGGWQFGEAALIDAGFYQGDHTPGLNDWKGRWTGLRGITSKKDFLNSPAAQWHAVHTLMPQRWAALTRMGLHQYVGRLVKGVEITQSGLLAASHLMGPGGVRDFLRSGGGLDPWDGNRTRVSDYMRRFPSFETPYDEAVTANDAAAPPPVRIVDAGPAPGAACGARSGMTIAEAAKAVLDCRLSGGTSGDS